MLLRRQVILRIVMIATLVAASLPVVAKERAAPVEQDWARVESLAPGRRVTVKRFSDPKVKGVFVSATPESVVVQSKSGEVTIARDDVSRVLARRGKMRLAPWIGLGAGFALGAGLTVGEGDFVQPSAAFAFGAAGAALGYLGGWAVRGIAQNALIYHAPRRGRRH